MKKTGISIVLVLLMCAMAQAQAVSVQLAKLGDALKEEVIRTVRRYFSDELGRRPIVVPHVVEV